MVYEYYKKLRRLEVRQKRRQLYREMHENQLVDIAYRGLPEEQKKLDQLLRVQQQWLNKTA